MKKILQSLFVFLATFCFAQEDITLDQLLINSGQFTQAGLNNRVLYQRSIMYADIPHFNSGTNTATHPYFEQAILEMYLSSNQFKYASQNTLREKVLPQYYTKNIVDVGILNTELEVLNYDDSDPNNSNSGFNYTGTALIPVSGKTQFATFRNTIISPLKQSIVGSHFVFRFRNDLLFSHSSLPIKDLTADLGDGIIRNIISNGIFNAVDYTVNVPSSQTLTQNYTVTYQDNTTLVTHSKIYANVDTSSAKSSVQNTLDFTLQADADLAFQGYDEPQTLRGVVDYRVYYKNPDLKLRKPILILDGFDPGDKRKIENSDYENPTSSDNKTSIYDLMNYGTAPNQQNLIQTLKANGYDPIIVNFPNERVEKPWIPKFFGITRPEGYIDGGADFIERNGLALVSLIRKLKAEIQQNGSSDSLVVMGPSMGGQISRYALAYMEKKFAETNDAAKWQHKVRLWISMDSPHHGANIPIGLQSVIFLMQKWGLASAEDFYFNQLRSPAGKQMLINQHQAGSSYHTIDNNYMNGRTVAEGFSENRGAPFYQQYYTNLYNNGVENSKGFPVNLRKLTMFNGSITGQKIGSDAQNTLNIRGFVNYWMLFWPIKVHAFSLETYTLPSLNTNTRIARFKIAWWDRTTVGTQYDNRGNLDVVAGGTFDGYDQIANPLMGIANKYNWVNIPLYLLFNSTYDMQLRANRHINSFMPIFSTAGIKNPDQNWEQSLAKNLLCTNETYFDSYYAESPNSEHVQLNLNSVNWLMKELDGNPQLPWFPINPGQLAGTNAMCVGATAIFSFFDPCKIPGIPVWSVSYNLQIIATTDYTVTVQALSGGVASISASFPNGQTVTKQLAGGGPQFANITFSPTPQPATCIAPIDQMSMDIPSDRVIAAFNNMTTTEINNSQNWEWQATNNLISLSGTGKQRTICPMGAGFTSFKVRAKNSCGWGDWYEYPQFEITAQPFIYYTVAPNPTTDILSVDLKNSSQQPTVSSNMSNNSAGNAKLFDSLGNEKASFNLINNKATININQLPAGIYYLKILVGNKWESHTVIKQ